MIVRFSNIGLVGLLMVNYKRGAGLKAHDIRFNFMFVNAHLIQFSTSARIMLI
jgi:hypothetical protein